jgi:hypothetical protein
MENQRKIYLWTFAVSEDSRKEVIAETRVA